MVVFIVKRGMGVFCFVMNEIGKLWFDIVYINGMIEYY